MAQTPNIMNALRLVAVSQARVTVTNKRLMRESELRRKRIWAAYRKGASKNDIHILGEVPLSVVYAVLRDKDSG